ncbi:hypothetical protein BDL97_06G027300 [Sphagnum fallax]|nr:hypothetical protein BDL97_06G027300 [Sphagnum fallax]
MEDPLLTTLSMDTLAHEVSESSQQTGLLGGPPDINLPLSVEISPSGSWGSKPSDLLDVGLLPSQSQDLGTLTSYKGKRWVRRGDTIWGAWFFFNHYFRPALSDKCQNKMNRDGLLLGPLDKSDLRLDIFLVQHDMENMYMWAFKERTENALGKMQLRSYMNGHARFGEPQFPFSVDKGFARSHRMQRKHYRGLSNPQCVHGVEVVRSPNLSNVSDEDKRRWMQLTGRDLNFSIPPDAEAFSEWRNLPSTEFDSERMSLPSPIKPPNGTVKKHSSSKFAKMNGANLNLTCQLPSPASSDSLSLNPGGKKKKSRPLLNTGLLPSGAKSIYEDDKGYLIMVSLPFTDMQRLRVSWRNTVTHGVVKIHCTSTARTPCVIRGDRTFKLTDPNPEHCPPGEFVREIGLATRIPENAELKAFYAEACAGLEIMVPKHHVFSEEREVRVFLPPQMGQTEALLL